MGHSGADKIQVLLRTKSKGRETRGGETRKKFISVMPTVGRQQSSISKMVSKLLKILPSFYAENVGQRSVGTVRWAVKVRSIIVLGSIVQGPLGLRAIPISGGGSFISRSRMFCLLWGLLPELKDRLERT